MRNCNNKNKSFNLCNRKCQDYQMIKFQKHNKILSQNNMIIEAMMSKQYW